MIYLIGGPPRVGKTTLVNYVLQHHPMHAISTDAIRYMLRRSIAHEALDPALLTGFDEEAPNTWDIRHPQIILEEQNAESKALWPALEQLINSYEEDGMDLLVEGVAILPAFSHGLKRASHSVFLGNTSASHIEYIRSAAQQNAHDWMHGYTQDELENAAEFFGHMSGYIKSEAKNYGLSYQEMRDTTFHADLEVAVRQLFGSA